MRLLFTLTLICFASCAWFDDDDMEPCGECFIEYGSANWIDSIGTVCGDDYTKLSEDKYAPIVEDHGYNSHQFLSDYATSYCN